MHSDSFIATVSILGIVLGTAVVWMVVRIANRRRKLGRVYWKTAAAAASVLVLYSLSFGPAYWWQHSSGSRIVSVVYAPLVEATGYSPKFVWRALHWYAGCAVKNDGQRLGIAPLFRNGPRAFHWFREVPISVKPPAPNPDGKPESN